MLTTIMHRFYKFATGLLLVSSVILIVCVILNEIDMKYNIFKYDKFDILGNVVYYAIMFSIYAALISFVFISIYYCKNVWFKKKL
jgi:hypothetical protein